MSYLKSFGYCFIVSIFSFFFLVFGYIGISIIFNFNSSALVGSVLFILFSNTLLLYGFIIVSNMVNAVEEVA